MNELDQMDNVDVPLSMEKIRDEQDLDGKLQGLIQSKARGITVTAIVNTKVYTIKGKVWAPCGL